MDTVKRVFNGIVSYFKPGPSKEDSQQKGLNRKGSDQLYDSPDETGATRSLQSAASADDAVKKGLHSVKICKHDATKLERELQGELFVKWGESCEVMKAKQIAFSNIKDYLDHLQNAYEGITPEVRKRMNGILFAEECWDYKMVEWKFNKGGDSVARYGMIAFGRSPDGLYVDCMYVMYRMDFKIAPKEIVTTKKHFWLWGLLNYSTNKSKEYEEKNLGSKDIQSMQNFFRHKALQGFYKEGVIESINYVPSLEDVPAQL